MHSGIMRLNELKGLFVGLVVGALLLLLFQLVGPFVEIYAIERAAEAGVESYEDVLGDSTVYVSYFLAANFLIVFCSSYSAGILSRHKKHLYSLICGSVFIALILFNRELFTASALLYGASIILGIGAMISTLFFTKEKRN